ncbi:hypothetical protein [Nocardioides sp. MH1]|uniref:hypothetical protein n=1 Tax=Nocardioides sp. MH1 TaxID=3242490 RepID=UPI00351FF373
MSEPSADPHVLEPGHAPTPFTADEIRDATVAGKEMWRHVDEDEEEPYLRVSRYLDCDPEGATMERAMHALDGTMIGETESARVGWLDLQRHASFPADDTTIDDDIVTTALGEHECLRYTVVVGEAIYVFWFAKDLPGMPVRQEVRQGGKVVATVTAVDGPA